MALAVLAGDGTSQGEHALQMAFRLEPGAVAARQRGRELPCRASRHTCSRATVKSSRPARGGSTRMVRSRSASQGVSSSSAARRRRVPRSRMVTANSCMKERTA